MRFGCCVQPDQIALLAQAGYDFCELPARAVLPFEDDTAALPALRAIAAAPLRPQAFNVLVPPELPLVGPRADVGALRSYIRRAFNRMAQLGGSVVVLGSGGARRIPPEMPRAQALDQLADALALATDGAARAGLELALEPLNRNECNVFTSLAESRAFIEERGLAGLRLLADLHHIEVEHESLTEVVAAAPWLAHVHVAGGGRRPPHVQGYDYPGLMAALHTIGYDERISVECTWDDLDAEVSDVLAFMRQQWQRVQPV